MLPSGYLQVEYIQATGSQYINSLFVPNQNTRVYVECVFPTASSTQALFGSRTSSSANQFQFVTSGNYYRSDYYTAASNVTNESYGTAKYYVDKAKNVFDLNGDHSLTQTYAAFTCPGPMYIFATNNNGSVYAQASATIYVFRVYDNDVLVRDLIPAERISDGAVGMYDRVEGKFYANAGTGVFAKGKYVVGEDEIVKLEYIRSTGAQCIDTEVTVSSATYSGLRLVCDCEIPKGQNMYAVNGCSLSGAIFYTGVSNGDNPVIVYGNGKADATTGAYYSGGRAVFDLDMPNNTYTVGGVVYSASKSAPTVSKNIALFAYFNASGYVGHTEKMYSCQIYNNGAQVRNYYPAKLPANGIIGLWDSVTGMLFTNAGTGEFIAGPYLASEEDVVLLEYIESTGEQYINTEFKPNQDTRTVFDAQMTAFVSSELCLYFGCRGGGKYYELYKSSKSGQTLTFWYNASSDKGFSIDYTKRRVVEINKNSATVDGVTVNYDYAQFQTSYAMYLGADNNSGTAASITPMRMYLCEVYDNDVLVRDYSPARFLTTEEVGLYDAANGTFYINAGTGTFIEGPEIPTELPAPQNLRATSVTESAITIEWDAVEKATGYKVFRNYVPVAENATTTYTDYTPEPYNGYVYGVVAYNDDMQSVQAEVRVASVGGNPILDLITDRTNEDVDYAKRLAAKGLAAMTEEERTAFLGGLKGAYNATDLNRVESAVAFLPSFLNGIQDEINRYLASLGVAEDELYRVPYDTPVAELETKTDWAIVDVPREADFARYLANIAVARNWTELPSGIPSAPESIQRFTTDAANAIEQVLLAVYETALAVKADKLVYADRAKDAWKYSGTFNSGQEVIF